MKTALSLLFLSGLAVNTSYAADNLITKKLHVQKSSALPAHLTTRVQWSKFPQPQYKNEDLKEQNRAAIIRIVTDETGQISKATVQESTGLNQLDQLLLQSVMVAQVKPYLQDGVALPIIGYQTFSLNLQEEEAEQPAPTPCSHPFNSKNWQAQQQNQSLPFTYRAQPQALQLEPQQLSQQTRIIKFNFKVNKHGHVTRVKIKKSSGLKAWDQQVIQSISQAQVNVPRKFWIYQKSKLQDQIVLNAQQCASQAF